jgi:menaquinol-cytochrome c reductase iron-sulfur subunit
MSANDPNRRGFLSACTKMLMGLISLLVAIPALGYFWAPLRKRAGGFSGAALVDAGSLADFSVGEWRLRPLEVVQEDGWKKTRVRHAVWVRRQQGTPAITVLSSICPHLGCPINWHPDRGQFNCPCHGGSFDARGQLVSGPPPRAMDPLDFEIRQGRVWVRWQDFKIGVREQIPVSS